MSVRNTVKSIQDIMRQDSGVDGDAQRISQLCWMFFLKIIDDQDLEVLVRLSQNTVERSAQAIGPVESGYDNANQFVHEMAILPRATQR